MLISTLFIIDHVIFDDEQNSYFSNLTAHWHVIRNNGTRQLIDAVIDDSRFAEAEAALAAWNPNVIGKWHQDGSIIELNDTTEYIALLPPIVTVDENEVVTETPRTEAVDVHRFSGWEARQWQV